MATKADTRRSRQCGAVLVVSLLLLLIMTVIGVAAMSTNSLEERIAGNLGDRDLAFQAAESALRDAENFINGVAIITAFDGNNGLLCEDNPTCPEPDYTAVNTWQGTNSREYAGGGTAIPGVSTQPRYVIKFLGRSAGSVAGGGVGAIGGYGKPTFVPQVSYFKVTARGVGQSPNSQVVLQTYYARTGL
jgi:type IV pilus assembly protein PilX